VSHAGRLSRVTTPLLELRNLQVQADGADILRGVDLSIRAGEVHALMGPNGGGKSTLANVVMGHPGYVITGGSILFRGEDTRRACPRRHLPRVSVPRVH
jgi:Fe-S cluster assembly ATP-binding protein